MGGGFTGHVCGSHDALDGPLPYSKDALEAKRSRDALEAP
jgi:hypothetical protein